MEIKEVLKETLGNFKQELLNEVNNTVEEKLKVVTPEMVKKVLHEMQLGNVKEVPGMSKDVKKNVHELFKAVFLKDYAVAKALSEGVDSAGGYLVPEEFLAKVIDLVTEEYGIVRPRATTYTMTRDTLNIPTISSKPSFTWVTEGNAISSGQPQFGQLTLTAVKAGLIIPVTLELFEDSAINLTDLIANIFANALGEAEDTQALTGTGSPFTGVFGNANVNTVTLAATKTAFTDVTADDLINLMYAVPSKYAKNGVFILNRSILPIIKKLKDNNGAYIFDPKDKTLFGYPVLESDAMPEAAASAANTPFIIFGDLKEIALGMRKEMSITLADQATVGADNLFEKDMVAFKATIRHAIAVQQPKAFAVLKTAAA